MRAGWVLAAGLGMACPAMAQDWQYQQGPEPGRHAAWVCGEQDGQTLCFGLSCDGGGPLAFGLSDPDSADLVAVPDLYALVFAGPSALPPFDFRSIGPGVFTAPVTPEHLPDLDRLKAAAQMELIYWEDPDAMPRLWFLSLKGSRDAITAVMEACPLPEADAGPAG